MRSDEMIADRYRLVRQIGIGGMGLVWLAFDEQEEREIALKRPLSAGGGIRADLEREAEIARRIAHPNAIEVFGVVGEGDDCWLAMEYFESESLATVLSRRTLPPLEVAAIGVQVAGALAAAHAAEVVHRDITPGNVLLADDGTAKVTDFGISAWRAATITSSGKISGTVAYVSPEVADGSGAKAPSDVYSLGATLFAAVEGSPPYGSGHPAAILTRIRDDRRESMPNAGPLAPVLSALLQRERDARPTAAQARDMLALVVDGQTVPVWTPRRRRRRWGIPVIAAAVVAVLVAAAFWVFDDSPTGPARTVLGEPATADPCALADPGLFSQFGDATINRNYGVLNRCDVLIDVPQDDLVDVVFEWSAANSTSIGTVVRHPTESEDGACVVPVTLADQSGVDIVAKTDDEIETDLCAVVEVAADHAISTLNGLAEIPRRPTPVDPRSLYAVDACVLITQDEMPEPPEPGYANWDCRWRFHTGALRVVFNLGDPDDSAEGTHERMSGRDVYVEEDGYGEGSCAAKVFHLRFTDEHGDPYVEHAIVVTEGDAPMDQLCQQATEFARPVAQRLPAL